MIVGDTVWVDLWPVVQAPPVKFTKGQALLVDLPEDGQRGCSPIGLSAAALCALEIIPCLIRLLLNYAVRSQRSEL